MTADHILLRGSGIPCFQRGDLQRSGHGETAPARCEKGYYRGTRFDWSGQIQSLKTKEHEYFGQWFEKYDPKLHDAIMGPVRRALTDEKALGYDEARPVASSFASA